MKKKTIPAFVLELELARWVGLIQSNALWTIQPLCARISTEDRRA